jgi:hypothetical protein
MQYKKTDNSPFGTIIGLLLMALIFVGLFMLAGFIFRILAYLAPALIILALILDYKVVLNYGKWLINTVKRNPVLGIAAIVLTVIGFPLVSAFLAGKAFLTRSAKKGRRQQEGETPGEYIDFEEVEEEPLELPELREIKREQQEKPPATKKENSGKKEDSDKYDDLFD